MPPPPEYLKIITDGDALNQFTVSGLTVKFPPPPVYLKIIFDADIANSLEKKGFMYNKFQTAIGKPTWGSSVDELIERNSISNSRSIAIGVNSTAYRDYNSAKSSTSANGGYGIDYHGIRPLFLFKE